MAAVQSRTTHTSGSHPDTTTPEAGNVALWRVFLAGLIHGVLVLLASPPLSWWPLCLLALVPLAWAAKQTTTRPLITALVFGLGVLPQWAIQQWWVNAISNLGYPFIVLALTCIHVAFVFVHLRLRERWARIPLAIWIALLWTGLEFLRGEIICTGYAWGYVAHPLIDASALAAPARVGGIYLITLLLGMITGGLVEYFMTPAPQRRKSAIVIAAVAALAWAGCLLAPTPTVGHERVRLLAFQTNVPQDNKLEWTLQQEFIEWERFKKVLAPISRLTDNTASPSQSPAAIVPTPDLIVWPETMMPGDTLEPSALQELRDNTVMFRIPLSGGGERLVSTTHFADELLAWQTGHGIPTLVGETALDGFKVGTTSDGGVDITWSRKHNSVYMIRDGHMSQSRYDKIRLTPFGEVIPYTQHWPWLRSKILDLAARGMPFDLTPGDKPTVFTIRVPRLDRDIRVVTPICFESTSASLHRRLVADSQGRRADLIANVTNDGWFSTSIIGRMQHLQVARWRAFETGTPTIRAANTGISAAIDHNGRIVRQGIIDPATGAIGPAAVDVEGLLPAELPITTGLTLYTRFGDVPGWVSLAAALAMTLSAILPRRWWPIRRS